MEESFETESRIERTSAFFSIQAGGIPALIIQKGSTNGRNNCEL